MTMARDLTLPSLVSLKLQLRSLSQVDQSSLAMASNTSQIGAAGIELWVPGKLTLLCPLTA